VTLSWRIDQLHWHEVKDSAGNPHNPSYFKRALQKLLAAVGDDPRGVLLRRTTAA
jgi:hypothetical protein